MNLSPSFTLEEMTASETAVRYGIDNTPDNEVLMNLRRLALFLEEVRAAIGMPIRINSAYRSVETNKKVGGKPTSQHCRGVAADIRVKGMTPDQVVKAIINAKLPYDQVIREFDSWTHVSIPNTKDEKPRKMALIIDKAGTRPFSSAKD
jgi:zinc D-Ala-D-Ala carboxypeptidase